MQVAIRVDASPRIGLGHLKRCLALAAALRDCGAEVLFLWRDLGVDVGAKLRAEGFEGLRLGSPGADPASQPQGAATSTWSGVPYAQDVDESRTALAARGAVDWLVVDHYGLDARWHEAMAKALSTRIAVIDDLADRPLAAGLLVDHNLAADHRAKYRGRVAATARLLVGPRFALLGPAYERAPRFAFHSEVRSIGIFLGGTDPEGLTPGVLDGVRNVAGFTGAIEVVGTSANPRLAELRAACALDARTTLTVDLADLAAFFARHDLQIGAGGGATWERCCIGAPTLALVCAENQRVVLPELERRGAVVALDDARPESIGRAVAELVADPARRQALSSRAAALVDGLGARRVALAMSAPSLVVRSASRADADRLHRWRNDERTRAVSADRGEIALEAHRAWLESSLADAKRTLLVAEVGRIAVGSIRFDETAAGRFTVSLYLDPDLHGLGLGRELLARGEERIRRSRVDVVAFEAVVLLGNRASARLFEAAGYDRVGALLVKSIAAPPLARDVGERLPNGLHETSR